MHQQNPDKENVVPFAKARARGAEGAGRVASSAGCQHHWQAREDEYQTLVDEGKKVWRCADCGEVTITYSWRSP